MYRKSERMLGNQASFQDLARKMNEWSKVPGKTRPETRFNTMNLFRRFRQQGGKEKSPMENPYRTKD